MPLLLVHGDIRQLSTQAIVEPVASAEAAKASQFTARPTSFFQSFFAFLHSKKVCPAKPGQAILVDNHTLGTKQLIRSLLPAGNTGTTDELSLLAACYGNALHLAKAHSLESVAIPLLSLAQLENPAEQALHIAQNAIAKFLAEYEMDVYLVVPEQGETFPENSLLADVREYIDLCSGEAAEEGKDASITPVALACKVCIGGAPQDTAENAVAERSAPSYMRSQASLVDDVEGRLKNLEETFSECVLRIITEKKMTEVEAYKKANLDRKLFSKIRSNKDYTPSKATALALAIALELDLDDTEELLLKAGFALSHSHKFDIIVEYFILEERYDIFEINEVLFAFDQPLLGAK